MEGVRSIYQSKNCRKYPGNFSAAVTLKKASISTQTITLEYVNVENQIENIDKQLECTMRNTEPWIRGNIENYTENNAN